MKTKNLFLLVLAIFVVSLTFGQTIQQKKALDQIDQKLQQLIELQGFFDEQESLKNSLVQLGWAEEGERLLKKKAIESRLRSLKKRLSSRQKFFATNYDSVVHVQRDIEHLQEQKKVLEEDFIAQAIEQSVPKEIAPREARRRHRSLGVREGESSFEHKDKLRDLSIEKLESAFVEADPVLGYKGLLFNDTRHTKVTFVIKNPELLDDVSQPLYAKESREVYLLPGEYDVHTYVDGYLVQQQTMRVRPKANPIKIKGKDYNFAVIRDKDGRY